eukprot:11413217-Alexandrium_andersonii.AAC.1
MQTSKRGGTDSAPNSLQSPGRGGTSGNLNLRFQKMVALTAPRIHENVLGTKALAKPRGENNCPRCLA